MTASPAPEPKRTDPGDPGRENGKLIPLALIAGAAFVTTAIFEALEWRFLPHGGPLHPHFVAVAGTTLAAAVAGYFALRRFESLRRQSEGERLARLQAEDEVERLERARKALRASEERTRALLESAVDGMITIDDAGIIESLNPAAERLFGYRAEELVGENVKKLMPSPYREEHDGYLANYRETGERKIIGIGREVMGQRRDGTTFPMDLAVSEVQVGGNRSFIGTVRDIRQRKEADEALRRERDFAEGLVETAQVIVLVLDVDGRIMRYNRYMEEISGVPLAEVQGEDWFETFLPEAQRGESREQFSRVRRGVSTRGTVSSILTRKGAERRIEWYDTTLRDAAGRVSGVLAIGQDITERLQLEAQFLQVQKMEAIGRLAGGVAHDFNTILGSITGYSELLLAQLDAGEPAQRPAEQIRQCAERGAGLTRQLLAFSRRQVLKTQVVDLNAVLGGMDDMLQRLIGAGIHLTVDADPRLGKLRADAGQLEQVLMNLVVNASDAMPDGGELLIETANVDLAEPRVEAGTTVPAGEYVQLTVADTGHGMDEETKRRLFEPFFTTKAPGKGTGLGLSTAYGIVRQSGGAISVASQPDAGTTFRIYLPRTDDEDEAPAPAETEAASEATVAAGEETVLLVEDDATFRELIAEVLEANGYTVLAAEHPAAALEMAERQPDAIDLVISDLVMPGMTGPELVRRLTERCPEMRVLLMSGYSAPALADGSPLEEVDFLQKPFSTSDLVGTVRQILDRP